MEQLYGESPEIRIEESYNTNGGIALYSTPDEGTIYRRIWYFGIATIQFKNILDNY